MKRVAFRILGSVEARVESQRIPLNGKQRSLLAMLLLNANRVVSAERLAAALWSEPLPAAVTVRVRTLVSELRRALASADDSLIATQSPGYLLVVEPGQLDLDAFVVRVETARQSASSGRQELAVVQYDEALTLWNGVALDGAAGPFVEVEAARLAELRLQALEERVAAMLSLGRHAEVVAELSGLIAEHPTRERPCSQLMVALYRCGRRGEALEAYRRLRARLIDELGLEPTPELQRLHQQLLTGDPALQQAARAAPARPAPSRQLPPDTGRLIGRQGELDRLDELNAGPDRLLLVVGAAGIGKTTAVVHWAHRTAEQFPDGQLFLDMRGFDRAAPLTPAEALPQLLHALGTPAEAIPLTLQEQIPLYRTATAGRQLLLVLDNVAEPDQVRPLLPGSPRCLTVVTSRDRLGGLVAVDGARRVTLDVLSPAEAVEVIIETAGADRSDADPTAALELARLSGYLPLALRITGARLADQPHHTIRHQVNELAAHGRMAELRVDGDRRADVRSAFDLSYNQLPSPAKRMFRLLSLVPAPAGLATAAAAALAEAPLAEAEQLLDTLARVHLVTATTADRFTCHDLLLDYAAELAAAEDPAAQRDEAIGRLLEFYLHTTDNSVAAVFGPAGRLPRAEAGASLGFSNVAEARAWMANEWDNVVASIEHAATHGPRPLAWHLADALRPIMRLGASMPQLLAIAATGLAAARAEGDPLGEGAMCFLLGQLRWRMADYRSSVEECDRALALYRRAGWRDGESAVLRSIGTSLIQLGQIQPGIDRLFESLAIDRETGNRFNEAVTLTNLAGAYLERGDLERALQYHVLALPALTETGHRHGETVALANLGLVLHAQGRLDEALKTLEESLAACRDVGSRHQEASVLISIGTVHCDAGRHEQATTVLSAALDLAGELGDGRLEVFAHNGLANVATRLNRAADAVVRLENALASVSTTGHQRARVEALLTLSRAYGAEGSHESAHDRATQALDLAKTHGYVITISQAHSAVAAACLGLGDVAGCLDHAERALLAQQESGQRLAEARTLITLGEAHQRNGRDEEAASCWRRARALFEEIGAR